MTDEPRPDRMRVFRRGDGKWDWHVVAPNGEVLYGSAQGYEHRLVAIEAAQHAEPDLTVEVEEVTP